MPPKTKKNIQEQQDKTRSKTDFSKSISFHEYEENYLASSTCSDRLLVLKPQDLKQKLMIAANITIECKKLKANITAGKTTEGKIEPILDRVHNFTNLPKDEIKTIYDGIKTKDRSFSKILKDMRLLPDSTAEFIADDIRNLFFKFIVQNKHFPSKIDIIKELKVISSKYCNEILTIQKLVKNKLIKYQHLSKVNKYFLTEHPEKVYQRTLYLNRVKMLRMQERNFVYVEVRRILPRGTAVGFIAGVAAFPKLNKLEKFFTKDSPEPIARKWLQQRILPLIPEGSVIVLAQPQVRRTLNQLSKKSDFIAYLDQYNIPYDKNAHTAELYKLFMQHKCNSKEKGVYDNAFLDTGHTLVPFPLEWKQLNFFRSIWAEIQVVDATHPGRPEFLKQKILNCINSFPKQKKTEELIIAEEFKMMKEDNVMETIIDNFYEMVKNGDVTSQDFPKESCGDKNDNFEINVSEIILFDNSTEKD